MQTINRKSEISNVPQAFGLYKDQINISLIEDQNDTLIYKIDVPQAASKSPLCIQWKMKALGVKGIWSSNNILDKRFRTDWEMPKLLSSISVDAPIVNLFGFSDENIVSIACSDLINLIHFEASLREEDNHFYFKLHFFVKQESADDYQTKIFINTAEEHFSNVIQELIARLVQENKIDLMPSPPLSNVPLYSTWYSFHQSLDALELIKECELSKDLGYDLIILDDGWQTMDDGRGYDYTGDWKAERIPEMKHFVAKIHDIGMGLMLWYSVPFCGIKSKAYQTFKGKFLTENHYWAPVFDPRFPEVRNYLTGLYAQALQEWNIDGFKLDFIDDFKIYEDTELNELHGRDTLSIPQGVHKLIQEIARTLKAIKPDVLIEFRQQYINPSLRLLGNMFRAFDCPNDALMNRVRTTDVKLLCGTSAVHSDMLTWHKEEPIEVAALQFSNIIFSVPQLSVRIEERSEDEVSMIRFYTEYWIKHKSILLHGKFKAYKPLSNYPFLSASDHDTTIFGLYEDVALPFDIDVKSVHIINGKMSNDVIVSLSKDYGDWKRSVFNCMGKLILEDIVSLQYPIQSLNCPANGIIFLKKESMI